MISIKITGLLDMILLKRYNDSVLFIKDFWKKNNVNGLLTGENVYNALQLIYSGISEEQFENYVRTIHNYEGNLSDVIISLFSFQSVKSSFK
jgi:hypothetical protein